MRMPILAALTFAATAIIGTTSAFAIPTACYGGVCVPASGAYIDNSLSAETLVDSAGDNLSGIFKATSIADNALNLTYAGYGSGGVYLAGVFKDFIVSSIVGNQIFFTGGTLQYFVSGTDNFNAAGGSAAGDIAAVEAGTLWASFIAAADINGNTLVITLNGTPLNFTGAATNDVFLDVDTLLPGLAGAAFNTNTMLDTNSILRDLKFAGTASPYNGTPCTADFEICGANTAKGLINSIPEPITLSLFGAGLAGAAALRRRKKA